MDIFKLIFHHDMLLEQLSGNEDARNKNKPEMGLEDFMKPVPTYTKYYFSGTRLNENLFGLTTLGKREQVCRAIETALGDVRLWLSDGTVAGSLDEALKAPIGSVIVAAGNRPDLHLNELEIDGNSGVRDRVDLLKEVLDDGAKVIYLENAHHGTDLHMFSKGNMYEPLFRELKPLVNEDFRYFSINGKRMSGERMFYFETWTLDRPPHGFEEVGSDSVLGNG